MYVITKWCAAITDSGEDEETLRDHSDMPCEFRLLDDDSEVYCYGFSTSSDDEAAFDPLDGDGADYGCTMIEYKNPVTGEFEQL